MRCLTGLMIVLFTTIIFPRGNEKIPHSEIIEGVNRNVVMAYCDTCPIDKLEGLWAFPDDEILLWIKKCSDAVEYSKRFQYQVIAVEAEDQYIVPGSIIGYLSITPDADQYRMWLFTDCHNTIFSKPQDCVATLIEDGYGIAFTKKEHRVTINPMGLLPNFWRIIKVQTSDPKKTQKRGFIKVYPSYDGNGSMRNSPRYL